MRNVADVCLIILTKWNMLNNLHSWNELGRFREHFETSEILLFLNISGGGYVEHTCRSWYGNSTTNIGRINLWNLIFIKFYRSLDVVGCSVSKRKSVCGREMMWHDVTGEGSKMLRGGEMTLPASFIGFKDVCSLSLSCFLRSFQVDSSKCAHNQNTFMLCTKSWRKWAGFCVSFWNFSSLLPTSFSPTLMHGEMCFILNS